MQFMQIDNDKIYTIPLVIGSLYDQDDRPDYIYSKIVNIALTLLFGVICFLV